MNSKQIISGFKERLVQLIGEEAPYPWGEQVGIAKATMHGLLSNASPTTATLMKIGLKTQASLSWLLLGHGPKWLGTHPIPVSTPLTRPNHTSSGEYLLAPQPLEAASVGLPTEWLGITADQESCVWMMVKGDGMEPTLRPGDVILMDQNDVAVRSDTIYIIDIQGEWVPKRLQSRLDGSVMVACDNPAYASEIISADKRFQLRIVGRVIWIGRRV
ncbi:MAG: hypothetical protein H7839_19090 [Magnetococcus sp. YQC-5]